MSRPGGGAHASPAGETTTPVTVANPARRGRWWRGPVLAVVWLALVAPVVTVYVVATTLRRYARDLPAVPDLEAWNDQAPRSSVILAADGTVLADLKFRDGVEVGHRWLVRQGELPPVMVQALLAAEDVRFPEHDGVDVQAVLRAARANYQAGAVVEGASTITQQVARNLLPAEIGKERSVRRKVREALLARKIERAWSKAEILTTYANLVFLGEGAYGVRAAARAYFDVPLERLTAAQAATIASLIRTPSEPPTTARRDRVLALMGEAGFLDDDALAAALAAPLGLRRPVEIAGSVAPWYTEHVRRLLADSLPGSYDLGGLVVETAALPALAVDAEARARAHTDDLARRGPPPEVGALLWDHRTGYVEALVGGRAWDATNQFDRVMQACRQPGSAWKPLVYGAALFHDAITLGSPLRDAPIAEYDEINNVHYKPKSGKRFRGVVLARDGFASSLNTVAIDVAKQVGSDAVIGFARRLGITTEIADVTPMALGASCVRPIELARAYATIARRGWTIAPRFVVRVRQGENLIFDAAVPEDPWLDPARRLDRAAALAGADPDERVGVEGSDGQLVDDQTAFLLGDLMAGVVARGTGTGARRIGRPAAGKTGTTNDNTDAWFVGYTGRLLGAVWIGHDDPRQKLGSADDGAHGALPLWVQLVRAAEGDRPDQPVAGPPPPGLVRATIDRETGLLAAPGAGGAATLWFKQGTQPTDVAGRVTGTSADFGRAAHEF